MTCRFIVSTTPTPAVEGDKDDSSYDRTFTLVGTVTPTFNENSKFGSGTLKFIGNDQKLTTPANANLNLSTTFTIDCWVRFDPYYLASLDPAGGRIVSNYQKVAAGEDFNYDGYELGMTNTGYLQAWYYNSTSETTYTTGPSTTLIADGGWHHVTMQSSLEGKGNQMRIFVDGNPEGTPAILGTAHDTVTVNPFTIGARADATPTVNLPFLNGTIDELEVIDGVAKFSVGGFTPPVAPNTSTANHLLLMHFDSDVTTPTVWSDAFFTGGGTKFWAETNMDFFSSPYRYEPYDTPASMASTNGPDWYSPFRPTKVRITGTGVTPGTITVRDGSEGILATGTAAEGTTTMQLSFTDQTSTYDMRYFRGLEAFTVITAVEFDAKPKDAVGA